MCDFIQNKHYYFIGDPQLIEDFVNASNDKAIDKAIDKINDKANDKTQLGKFIEYIGLPYVSDWLHDAKSRFEYGIISRRYYDTVFAEDVNVNEHMKMNR